MTLEIKLIRDFAEHAAPGPFVRLYLYGIHMDMEPDQARKVGETLVRFADDIEADGFTPLSVQEEVEFCQKITQAIHRTMKK